MVINIFLCFSKFHKLVVIASCNAVRVCTVCAFLNKNRLSSTTCGEELQKIIKVWQSFKELSKKYQKIDNFKQFAFDLFLTSK